MLLAMVFLILFALIELVFNFKKHISYAFALDFTGLALITLGAALYILKMSYVPLYTDVDRYIHSMIKNFKIGVPDISLIITAGTALLMLGSVYFLHIVGKCRFTTTLYLSIPIIAMVVWYSPYVTYRVFLLSTRSRIFSERMPGYINLIFKALFIIYMILPLIKLYTRYRHSQIHNVFMNAVYLMICIAIVDVYAFTCLIFGFPAPLMPWNVDWNKFAVMPLTDNLSMLLTLMTPLLVISILFITIWYKPFGSLKLFDSLSRRRALRDLNTPLKTILHSNKNQLLVIQRLTEQLKDYIESDKETAFEIVDEIGQLTGEGLRTLNTNLQRISDIDKITNNTDLYACICGAVKKTPTPKNIEIKINYTPKNDAPPTVNASPYHINECIINLLHNAVDAINETNKPHGLIEINLITEFEYACIEVKDNGCGLSKKAKREIFSALYSTKNSMRNWGMGLAYTQNAVYTYGGSIYVKSKQGEYTLFQIALPLTKRNNGGISKWTKKSR